MSKCIKRNREFLEKLLTAPPDVRKRLINKASADEVRAISEIALNVVKGSFQINANIRDQLAEHKHHIRKLSKRTVSHKLKKHLLSQKGGFLPLLLSPVLSALGIIVGKTISSHIGL